MATFLPGTLVYHVRRNLVAFADGCSGYDPDTGNHEWIHVCYSERQIAQQGDMQPLIWHTSETVLYTPKVLRARRRR
jgi:hypothetical protein